MKRSSIRIVLFTFALAGFLIVIPQVVLAACGDAVLDAGEACDDGNNVAGDCCDAACQLETGEGSPPCCDGGVCQVGQDCGDICGVPTFLCGIAAVTGQCKCEYDECAGGVRFVDRGLTVFDCQTELEWEKKTASNVNDIYTWSAGFPWDPDGAAFTSFLPGLDGFAGIPACEPTVPTSWCTTDGSLIVNCPTARPVGCWRLPELDELRSILLAPYVCQTHPCIDPVFGPTANAGYWSATRNILSGDSAFGVSFLNAYVFASPPRFGERVRAVRSRP